MFSFFAIRCCCSWDISFYFLEFSFCGDILTSTRNVSASLENVAPKPSLRRTCSLKQTRCSALLDAGELLWRTRGCYSIGQGEGDSSTAGVHVICLCRRTPEGLGKIGALGVWIHHCSPETLSVCVEGV